MSRFSRLVALNFRHPSVACDGRLRVQVAQLSPPEAVLLPFPQYRSLHSWCTPGQLIRSSRISPTTWAPKDLCTVFLGEEPTAALLSGKSLTHLLACFMPNLCACIRERDWAWDRDCNAQISTDSGYCQCTGSRTTKRYVCQNKYSLVSNMSFWLHY